MRGAPPRARCVSRSAAHNRTTQHPPQSTSDKGLSSERSDDRDARPPPFIFLFFSIVIAGRSLCFSTPPPRLRVARPIALVLLHEPPTLNQSTPPCRAVLRIRTEREPGRCEGFQTTLIEDKCRLGTAQYRRSVEASRGSTLTKNGAAVTTKRYCADSRRNQYSRRCARSDSPGPRSTTPTSDARRTNQPPLGGPRAAG